MAGALLAAAGASPALALVAGGAPPQSLRDALFGERAPAYGMPPPPPVARYRLDVGETVVVDRVDRDEALLRIGERGEVWALKGVGGAHGDMIFRNDVGEQMMRATRFGGLTIFTAAQPEGAPAALEGGALALRVSQPIGPQALLAALTQASARASRAAGRAVLFDAPDVTPVADWLFADAAALAADAFVRTAQGGRRAIIARFAQVRLISGRSAGVGAEGAIVRITVVPARGVAGRPSSRRIAQALGRR